MIVWMTDELINDEWMNEWMMNEWRMNEWRMNVYLLTNLSPNFPNINLTVSYGIMANE